MFTGQTYATGNAEAITNEPTANQALQMKVRNFFGDVGATGETVWALNLVLQHWLRTEYKQHARELNDEDMKLWDNCTQRVLNAVDLINALSEVNNDMSQVEALG